MRVHAFRLTPGCDLKEELARYSEQHGFRAALILTCVGSLSAARLRMPGGADAADTFRTFEEPMEIMSLVGALSPDGLHLHISLSRGDASCVGGHLVTGCVIGTTAEVVIGEAPGLRFRRLLDSATGYRELSVRSRLGES